MRLPAMACMRDFVSVAHAHASSARGKQIYWERVIAHSASVNPHLSVAHHNAILFRMTARKARYADFEAMKLTHFVLTSSFSIMRLYEVFS